MEPSGLWFMVSTQLASLGQLLRDDPRFREGYRYSVWHIVRIYLFLLWKGYSSNVFYQKLSESVGFRRHWGLPTRLISHSQFKKRRGTIPFVRALLELLCHSGARALRLAGLWESKVVIMDLTRLPSDVRRDPYGAWGFDSKGFFFGYKLGLITSEHGVILGLTLMKGNWNEFRVNRKLLRMARETLEIAGEGFEVDVLLCDAGFDGESTYRGARKELEAWALCPPRRRRNPKAKGARVSLSRARSRTPYRYASQLLWRAPAMKRLFRKRVGIERVNGQLKDDPLRIDQMPRRRRTVWGLLALALGKAILYNTCLIVNAQCAVPIRRVKQVWAA